MAELPKAGCLTSPSVSLSLLGWIHRLQCQLFLLESWDPFALLTDYYQLRYLPCLNRPSILKKTLLKEPPMTKRTVVHTHKGIVLSLYKKEMASFLITSMHVNVGVYYASWKNWGVERQMLYDFMYLWNSKYFNDKSKTALCLLGTCGTNRGRSQLQCVKFELGKSNKFQRFII